MEERARRIVETAMDLAEKGGYEAVRLRDVAAQAGVALGTVYKRFQSKEDILVAAIGREAEAMEKLLETTTISGDTEAARGTEFFQILTRVFLSKPNFARAVLKAMASGDSGAAAKVASYQNRVAWMIVAAVRGEPMPANTEADPGRAAILLQQVWFASLVGWMGGLTAEQEVLDMMTFTCERVLGDASI